MLLLSDVETGFLNLCGEIGQVGCGIVEDIGPVGVTFGPIRETLLTRHLRQDCIKILQPPCGVNQSQRQMIGVLLRIGQRGARQRVLYGAVWEVERVPALSRHTAAP